MNDFTSMNEPCEGFCCIDDPLIVGPQGPQGIPGPAGPQGPSGIASLDSMLVDNDGTQNVASDTLVNLGEIINSTGSSITFSPTTDVNVSPGSYIILFSSLVSNTNGASGDVGASILINGVVADNASEYVPATTTQTQITLFHSITVTTETTITVFNSSPVANLYHDTSLLVLKIA